MRGATTEQLASVASASGAASVGAATAEAISSLETTPGLVLAFASGELDAATSGVDFASATEGAPAAGLSGKGLMTAEGPFEEGCVAIAFATELRAAVARCVDASQDPRAAGREATREALERAGEPVTVLLLFVDSDSGDMAESVSGAYEAAGPGIPLAGGASGGSSNLQLSGEGASSDSVIAVALSWDRAMGIGVAQTSKGRGTPSIITRSDGQTIQEIDGRPAEQVYLEQLGLAGAKLTDEEFEALGIAHPLAQPELHGDVRLRHVLGRSGDGGIISGTHIPASAAIEFTELERGALVRSGAEAVGDAVKGLDGAAPRAALVFDCAGRKRALDSAQTEEVATIADSLGSPPPPLAGLYTHGEVARLQGAKGDRNHAVVTVAFG